jgi:ribosomal protein S18 acetylase RimI-like enzyme
MIRTANSTDIPIIRSIAENTWPDAYSNILSPEQLQYMLNLMYSDDALQHQMKNGHQFYIAEINEKPIGFASVSNEGNNVFQLNKLYILPNTQKTGVGKSLIQIIIEHAKQNGGAQIILRVNKQNKAKLFYERQGFSILNESILELEHGFVMDDYIMGINI